MVSTYISRLALRRKHKIRKATLLSIDTWQYIKVHMDLLFTHAYSQHWEQWEGADTNACHHKANFDLLPFDANCRKENL